MPVTMENDYACLFCITGREAAIARRIEQLESGYRATAVQMVKRKSVQGVTTCTNTVMLPGYVFVEIPKECGFAPYHLRMEGVLSVLTTVDGEWRLFGQDRVFAAWVFAQEGLIAFSTAYCEGDRIRIMSGPLKDLEGYITKVDKRNKSGQVCLRVGDREIRVWLAFDLVEKPL